MQHDVEPDAESDDEEDVPEEEEEEGGEYFVEHCHVDIVSGKSRMFGHEGDQLNPGEKKCNGGEMTFDIHAAAVLDKKDPDEDEKSSFEPVLDGEDVTTKRNCHLERFPYYQAKQQDRQGGSKSWSAQPQDDGKSSQQHSLQPVGEDQVQAGGHWA